MFSPQEGVEIIRHQQDLTGNNQELVRDYRWEYPGNSEHLISDLRTPGRPYLSHVEQQRYGVVEVGVGAAGVDPEVPQNGKQSRTGQQDAGHQEDVPQD